MSIANAAILFFAGWTVFSLAFGSAFALLRMRVKANDAAKREEPVEPQIVVDQRWASLRHIS